MNVRDFGLLKWSVGVFAIFALALTVLVVAPVANATPPTRSVVSAPADQDDGATVHSDSYYKACGNFAHVVKMGKTPIQVATKWPPVYKNLKAKVCTREVNGYVYIKAVQIKGPRIFVSSVVRVYVHNADWINGKRLSDAGPRRVPNGKWRAFRHKVGGCGVACTTYLSGWVKTRSGLVQGFGFDASVGY